MQFSATNMQCWVTSNFFQSQPLAFNVEIPANATQIILSTGAGRSDYGSYSLRNCPSYNSCTNFGYYISTCPVITNLGFGTSNLTGVLSPGSYRLTLDSINPYGYGSTEITNAVLEVSIPVLIFNATDKQCSYNSSETRCNANVSAVGNGQCFYPTTATSAAVFKAGESNPVSFSSNSTHIYWNCSTGNYSLRFFYLPIPSSQSWRFADSNLSSQHLLSTLQITNPNADNFTDVPFAFDSNGFNLESGELNGSTTLYSLQSKNLTALFSASVISYRLSSTSPIYFNFSSSFLYSNLSIANNFSIPFSFSTSDLPLAQLNCTENNFTLPASSDAVFPISCSPQVNYSFSNWAGLSATQSSTNLALSGPANQSIFVSSVSQKLLEMFAIPVRSEPDNFTYAGVTVLNLTGEFISISVQNDSRIDKDTLNYSLHLNNYASLQFNSTAALDFSNYLNVSFPNGSIPSCPAVICLDGLILKVAVSKQNNENNQINFSVFAFKPVQVESHVVSVSASPASAGQRGGGGGLPSYAAEKNDQQPEPTLKENSEVENYFNNTEYSTIPSAIFQETNAPIGVDQPAAVSRASSLSGFLTAFPSLAIFALPILLLACGASMLFLRKPKLVSRTVNNGKTSLTIFNSNIIAMQNLELAEVLPLKSMVEAPGCNPEESVIGKVLTWKKTELKKGEKWLVQYSSNAAAKRGKLSFVQNGKKHEKLF